MTRIPARLLLLATAGLVTACAAAAGDEKPAGIAPPTRIQLPMPDAMPAGKPVATSAVPREVRRAVVADAAKRMGVAESAVVITRAEEVTWPDGSLGCPEPGMMYTQALVPGFRVWAKSAAAELLYSTDSRGNVRHCHMPEGPAQAR